VAQKQIHWKQFTFNISYEILNPTASRDCVILHGWGSNKELMRTVFKDELGAFRHIYIDLPGFGNSTNPTVLNTHHYREIVAVFLETMSIRRDVIIGHSFGGKIATLLNPDLLVLLGSSGVPQSKSLWVWMKIYTFKLFKYLGLSKLRHLFVAADAKGLPPHMYESFKQVVNEDFRPHFANFFKKALIVAGTEDTAVSVEASRTIARLISYSTFMLLEGDHYFFMHHAHEIAQKIEAIYIEQKGQDVE